ncbi:MAG: cupin domain-containing protein [Lachnospiraceae bacterium]|nr:cupin domain-containing protein [Lachnospiraceae bacterium]
MKCIVLAGGSGDALWPLSRRNYPKQFMHLHSGRSPFQEAVTRNLPFCDEFLILTNEKYENIVRSQLSTFQELKYRMILEQAGRQTAPVLLLVSLLMEQEEELLVVSCDHIIGGGDYNGTVLEAQRRLKELEEAGRSGIIAIGCPYEPGQSREGHNFFDLYDDGQVSYIPAGDQASEGCESGCGDALPDGGVTRLADSGIFLITTESCKKAVSANKPALYEGCLHVAEAIRGNLKTEENGSRILLEGQLLKELPSVSVGDAIYRPWSDQGKVKVVEGKFSWKRLLTLERVADLWQENTNTLLHESNNTRVINKASEKLVVVNDADDLLVVNDKDAVYISRIDESSMIKGIIEHSQSEALEPYFDEGDVFYTNWGCKETLERGNDFSIKKLTILPGRSIHMHKHNKRSEHWSVISGIATIMIDDKEKEYGRGESILVPIGSYHEVRNEYARDLVLVEVSIGENVNVRGGDLIRDERTSLTGMEAEKGAAEPASEAERALKNRLLVRLKPAYKDYIWGGNRLRSCFGMETDLSRIAESWVLSAHRDGKSLVAGETGEEPVPFDRYIKLIGDEALGWKSQPYERFPMLVKFIDAESPLSVQVHPADTYALEHENDYGKNEMWYVIDAKEDAFVYLGFSRETSPSEVRERIREGTLTDILHKVPVKPGDAIMVPAGCIHAIGSGILILEVQQSSNATYRLYDYNRKDADGKLRPLHLEKALANMDYGRCEQKACPMGEREDMKGYRKLLLQQCKYFSVTEYEVDSCAELVMDASSFYSVVITEGTGTIESESTGQERKDPIQRESFAPGDSFFVPAGAKILRITGKCKAVISQI